MSHRTFDNLSPSRWVQYMRELFVGSGILEEQDVHLNRLDNYARTYLDALPPEFEKVIRPYVTWNILSRLRRSSLKEPITQSVANNARGIIRGIHAFLIWLVAHELTLATATQRDIDVFIVETRSRHLAEFLPWAHRAGHCRPLTAPAKLTGQPNVGISDEERWAIVERLLTDTTILPRTRVAGLLVLLYGQALSRICRLTVADMEIKGDDVLLRLGRKPVVLHESVATLVLQLRDIRGQASYASEPNRWLFPGALPGQPMAPNGLSKTLSRVGINVRQSRNIAILELVRNAPSSIVADVVGLNGETAEAWAKLAGVTFNLYPAVRRDTRDIAE